MWNYNWYSRFDYNSGTDPFTGEAYPLDFLGRIYNTPPSFFPDWPLFVESFGTDYCYWGFTPTSSTYQYQAMIDWRFLLTDGVWGGACYGFAETSLFAFYDVDSFRNRYPMIPQFNSLSNVNQNSDAARKAINGTQLWSGSSKPYTNYLKTPVETLQQIRQILLEDQAKGYVLIFYDNSGSSIGHTVVPYKIEKNPAIPTAYDVFIYDCIYPGNNQRLEIITLLNSWTCAQYPNWGGG